MSSAKPIALHIRPFQTSHLCFEVSGILGTLDTELGATITAFDFTDFYETLIGTPTVAGDQSRLLYDFAFIETQVAANVLATLRAEERKTALDNAIRARQNAYFGKYGSSSSIVAQVNNLYSDTGSKPARLNNLATIAQNQANQLALAYTTDARTGVVKVTSSALKSFTRSSGQSDTHGRTDSENMVVVVSPGNIPAPPGNADWGGLTLSGAADNINYDLASAREQTSSSGTASQFEGIENTDYGYRVPYLESQAHNERAQISLADQLFANFVSTRNVPNLDRVFGNELRSIDGNVVNLQIAFLNTILMSPINGTVTGIYRYPGDAIKAGEPVLRIEDNSTILVVANLVFRAPVKIGSTMTVSTSLFDSAALPTTLSGSVVSVRGLQDDDCWEVIAKCNNLDGSGNPIFPLGYHFDYDDTTVTIT